MGDRTHPKQYYSCVLILTHKKSHSQVLRLFSLFLEEFIGDIEAQQISILLVVTLHGFGADQHDCGFVLIDVPPEGHILLCESLQEFLFRFTLPKQLALDVFGLLLAKVELTLHRLQMELYVVLRW